MSFKWSEDLSTGIHDIDAQHIALIGQFNDLIEACSQKKGHEEVGRFLTFLTGYVNRHFDDEERAMARNVYDGIEAHIKEHEQYRMQLARLKDDVIKRGTTRGGMGRGKLVPHAHQENGPGNGGGPQGKGKVALSSVLLFERARYE